jgi:P27 family predicted phage terminase small subunit
MGKPKTPNSILKSRGSNYVRDEIEPETGAIEPTYDLSPEGKKAWDRICVEMEKLGILSPAYADFVTIAAGAVGDIEIASRDLVERGHISITERGETKNPSFTIKTSAQTIAHKYLSALGLTPTTIGKLVKPSGDDGNEFADL